MTCAACAARIEKVLNRVPGDAGGGELRDRDGAASRFDPARADVDALVAAVERAGYRARVQARFAEPSGATTRRAGDARYAALRREFVIVASLLTLPLRRADAPDARERRARDARRSAAALAAVRLATPVQFWIGRRFYVGAWHALRGGGANMDVLVALGTTMAWAFSAVVTVAGSCSARRTSRRPAWRLR